MRWVGDEEAAFGRTLDRGTALLAQLVAEAEEQGTSWIDAADAFKLHDTYGFPYDLTKELLAEQGLSVDDSGFEALMEKQRVRARTGAEPAVRDRHQAVISFASAAPASSFVGYETLRAETAVIAAEELAGNGARRWRWRSSRRAPSIPRAAARSPTPARSAGTATRARVADVYRVGDDQVIRLEGDAPAPGTRVEAEVEHAARHATMRNHTATHLLHAALRERLGTHVRQAGSAVRPDKLRFDFTHGAPLAGDELREIEDRVNEWIKASRPVRALHMERAEAEALGAMALFGEKYGDWVRVIEVDEVSRELCGGTHVANTAEVGIFAIVSEGSSAANVRRVEALTGPAAIDWFRKRSAALEQAGALLGSARDPLAAARRAAERLAALEQLKAEVDARQAAEQADRLGAEGEEVAGVRIVVSQGQGADQGALLDLADRIKARLGDAAVVLGGAEDGKVALVASFTDSAVERGLSAADVVREAAAVVGGGGGGRDTVAQAGGRDPSRLEEALQSGSRSDQARARRIAAPDPMRVLAIDHGSARAGCAISDPTGTIARPLGVIEPPDPRAVAELAAEHQAELVIVGLPVSLSGAEGPQATEARAFRDALAAILDLPVETYDERLTTRLAERSARAGASAPARRARGRAPARVVPPRARPGQATKSRVTMDDLGEDDAARERERRRLEREARRRERRDRRARGPGGAGRSRQGLARARRYAGRGAVRGAAAREPASSPAARAAPPRGGVYWRRRLFALGALVAAAALVVAAVAAIRQLQERRRGRGHDRGRARQDGHDPRGV